MKNCRRLATAGLIAVATNTTVAWAQTSAPVPHEDDILTLEEVQVIAAGEQVKQAPGVSLITSEEMEQVPLTNDISEIVRRQPGVNLTGNSSSGARGNNRQIDIRGMGPENTLILIDGKPVMSRNSVRYGAGGERDTRGDSNWVPPEAIESIEVLRGPAAARYGSGAAGGVVNIRTKPATERSLGVNVFTNIPEDSDEGETRRINVLASGPINETLSYRLYGNFNATDNDAPGVNPDPQFDGRAYNFHAGREGVMNRDLNARLTFRPSASHRLDLDAAWSRQGNKFAGDSHNSYVFGDAADATRLDSDYLALIGRETNRMTRSAISLTHFGSYGFGTSESHIQYERTDNKRLGEGLSGATEGTIQTGADQRWNESRLNHVNAKTEFHIPLGRDQVLTTGLEFRRESLRDPGSIAIDLPAGAASIGVPALAADRSTGTDAHLIGVFLEDNIYIGDALILTPGLRYDHHSEFGGNASPSLNASYQVSREVSLKGGIARAYKAPNLYQLNPNYVHNSAGNGCWQNVGPCYIQGNPDLAPEISINKEIGLAFQNDAGWAAGIAYFHNRYRNRISAGRVAWDTVSSETCHPVRGCAVTENLLQRWENSGPATTAGVEGSLTIPLAAHLEWASNFTYMSQSEDALGQPLSLIPEYTINSWLNWRATGSLNVNLSLTRYGKTRARTTSIYTGAAATSTEERGAYTLANLGVNYRINDNLHVAAGVKNLLDRQLQRTGLGANTYNEPGRSYYVGLSTQF